MVHAVYTRRLSRSRSWRKATVQSLAQALLKYEQIKTTLAKAKEAQRLVERLITLGKAGDLASRRRVSSLLNNPKLVARLFAEVAPRFANRPGGYTRILHLGSRAGDGASMAWVELVEKAEPRQPKPKEKAGEKPERVKEKTPQVLKAPPSPSLKVKEASEEPKAAPEKKKPKGFLEGLRSFFKGRPKEKE